MECWKCGANTDYLGSKISFRALCEKCQAWQHTCSNCKNHQLGLPNECRIPGTDYVRDREAFNFCEEFIILGKAPKPKIDPNSVAKRLFGDDLNESKPRNPLLDD